MLGLIVLLLIFGLIIGALGRLAVPGPNPMSIGVTIAIGIGGSFIGGFIGRALSGRDDSPLNFFAAVVVAAGIVWFMQRRNA